MTSITALSDMIGKKREAVRYAAEILGIPLEKIKNARYVDDSGVQMVIEHFKALEIAKDKKQQITDKKNRRVLNGEKGHPRCFGCCHHQKNKCAVSYDQEYQWAEKNLQDGMCWLKRLAIKNGLMDYYTGKEVY